jgi:S1-C subfamily serine protease
MDQFGVTDARLKALARTPFTPAVRATPLVQSTARDSAQRDFLGAKVKNVVGLGEVSAYGLPGEVGVLLVQVPAGSGADKAGLRQGDVIRKCGGRETSSMDDLFKVLDSITEGTTVTLDVWRLQQHVSVQASVGG